MKTSTWLDEDFAAGDLVVARVLNSLENRDSRGKARPVVLVEEVDGHWRVAGLTTNPRRRDGSLRLRVPNPILVGLRGPGFLWGNRLHSVCKLDLDFRIGVADQQLARLIVSSHPMSSSARLGLLAAAGCQPDAAEEGGPSPAA